MLKLVEPQVREARRVVVPFDGRKGEGREIAFLYRRPEGVARPPLVVMLGGIAENLKQPQRAIALYREVPEGSPMRRLSST